MNGLDATLHVIDILNDVGVPYLLVGSFSSNYYGIPRSTEDADIVIEVTPGVVSRIADCIRPPMHIDRQVSFETITMSFRNIISIDNNVFTIELFHLKDADFDQERFCRRTLVPFHGRSVWLPTPEDVIVQKLRWLFLANREKDERDIRDVLTVQRANLDWPYVYSWADQHGTRELIDRIRLTVPKI